MQCAPPAPKPDTRKGSNMSIRRSMLVGTALVAAAALWYLFRPDALVISKTVDEPFPAMAEEREPSKLLTGRFHSNAHETNGVATIYRLDDGRHVLRLTEFSTSNGPDVRVYLVAAQDVQEEDAAKAAGIVDLGALKGNVGDQNYDIPAGLDLHKYRAVSIWCRRFSVNFGAAPLVT